MPQKPHQPEISGLPHTPSLRGNDSTTQPERLRSQLGEHASSAPIVPLSGEFLQVKEIATAMKVSATSVIKLVKEGRLPALNLSRGRRAMYRIPREAWEEFKRAAAVPVPERISAKPVMKLPPGVELYV